MTASIPETQNTAEIVKLRPTKSTKASEEKWGAAVFVEDRLQYRTVTVAASTTSSPP